MRPMQIPADVAVTVTLPIRDVLQIVNALQALANDGIQEEAYAQRAEELAVNLMGRATNVIRYQLWEKR